MAELKVGGNVVAVDDKQKNKLKTEKLTVLKEGSKESIFSLIFSEPDRSHKQ